MPGPAKPALAIAALAGGLLASEGALAQDRGPYLGGSLGQSKFTEWCDASAITCDDTDTAWKLFGGYRLNKYVAVEATYIDWGAATGTVAGPRNVSAEQTSLGVAAVGSLELGPRFSVFGKAGFLMTEQELPASTRPKRDETEFHYGLGARFSFTSNWAARAEWERTEKLKVEMLSIGVEYRF